MAAPDFNKAFLKSSGVARDTKAIPRGLPSGCMTIVTRGTSQESEKTLARDSSVVSKGMLETKTR
jgi:hypothetical protein